MDRRLDHLRQRHAAHPHPERVRDELFARDEPFFDARDLVQVKYEMLRRVHHEGQTVTQTVVSFGFSRPTFYEVQAAFLEGGLPALLPERPGPRRAHKLTDPVVSFLDAALRDDPSLRAPALAELVHQHLGVKVHPRSIERRLARQQKKLQRQSPPG
jgi:transposase